MSIYCIRFFSVLLNDKENSLLNRRTHSKRSRGGAMISLKIGNDV